MFNPEDEDQTTPENNPDGKYSMPPNNRAYSSTKDLAIGAAVVVAISLIGIVIQQIFFDPDTIPYVIVEATTAATTATATETTTATAAATTTTKPVEANTVTAYITEYGTVYHIRRSCQYIRDKSDEELRILTDEEAEDQGYRVCSRCG